MPDHSQSTPVEILLVEDSADDADLMTEALYDGTLAVRVHWVEDGEQALAYLRRHADNQKAGLPDLILLDYRLPRKNGQEVLDEIRQDPQLRCIPVVIMTSFDSAIPALYDHHANCCIVKPADQEQFALTVKKIEHFWLTVAARVPRRRNETD